MRLRHSEYLTKLIALSLRALHEDPLIVVDFPVARDVNIKCSKRTQHYYAEDGRIMTSHRVLLLRVMRRSGGYTG